MVIKTIIQDLEAMMPYVKDKKELEKTIIKLRGVELCQKLSVVNAKK